MSKRLFFCIICTVAILLVSVGCSFNFGKDKFSGIWLSDTAALSNGELVSFDWIYNELLDGANIGVIEINYDEKNKTHKVEFADYGNLGINTEWLYSLNNNKNVLEKELRKEPHWARTGFFETYGIKYTTKQEGDTLIIHVANVPQQYANIVLKYNSFNDSIEFVDKGIFKAEELRYFEVISEADKFKKMSDKEFADFNNDYLNKRIKYLEELMEKEYQKRIKK